MRDRPTRRSSLKKSVAARIVDATVANALRIGINKRYDSMSGGSLDVPGLGMSCTLLTMILDGLSQKYSARVVPT
jgi:hypothetical protein